MIKKRLITITIIIGLILLFIAGIILLFIKKDEKEIGDGSTSNISNTLSRLNTSNISYNQVIDSKIGQDVSSDLYGTKLDGSIIEWRARISAYYSQITGIKFCVVDDMHQDVDIDEPCDFFWASSEEIMDANDLEKNPEWDGSWVPYVLNYYKVPFDKDSRYYDEIYTIKGSISGLDCGINDKCVPNIDILSIEKNDEELINTEEFMPDKYGGEVIQVGGDGSMMHQVVAYLIYEDLGYLKPAEDWVNVSFNNISDVMYVECKEGYKMYLCNVNDVESISTVADDICTADLYELGNTTRNKVNIACSKE